MREPRGTRALVLGAIAASVVIMGATTEARAQTGCRTPECNLSTSPPAACVNRASPYTTTVLMQASGINFIYLPQNPKIEPFGCIAWQAVGGVIDHSSAADDCADTGTICSVPDPDGICRWDTGNVAGNDVPPAEICSYAASTFPAGTSQGFYCRTHSSPAHIGTMHGFLNVTTPIDVTVSKSGNDVLLTWTGGGISGDVTYKVVRNLVGDPLFTVGANTVTGNPDGGTTGTTFTELGGLSDPASHYYIVRNRQINE